MNEMVQLVSSTIIFMILITQSPIIESTEFCSTKTTSCVIGEEIRYPFWIDDGSLGEGCTNYPGFGVKCMRGGTPVINISNNLYAVVQLDTGTFGTIRVREVAINGQECPQPQHNFSLDRFLRLDYKSINLTIFYNCSSSPIYEAHEILCLRKYYNNSTKHSYAFRDGKIPVGFDWHGRCEKNVLTYIDNFSYSSLTEALQRGFWLQWETPVDCTDCEDSGGRCSSNQTTGAITCDCPHDLKLVDKVCPYDYALAAIARKRKRIITGLCIGVGSILLVLIYIWVVYRDELRSYYKLVVSYWRVNIKNLTNVEVFLENYECLALQRYKYSALKEITNSYRERLGQGGYGSVFKGKLRDGRLVAVKVLNEAKGKGEDFINEVAAIGMTNHVNVVSLLGFCTEKNKRALIYEYMPNGSLERFIYNEKNSSTTSHLGLEKLYEITLGIARGLEYLHRGSNTRILHLDIKPHNILLDKDFCPRISDFGLAKLCPTKESTVSMVGGRGTIGYIAPEIGCRNFGGVSHKSDVYSYGMMVLEIVGGRKNIDPTVENISEIYFPQWVYTHLERYNALQGTEDADIQELDEFFKDEKMKKMVMVGLWSVQPHPRDRPSMSKVVEMLEENNIELGMPPNPFPGPSSVSYATL